ncbi:hypothetical protein E2C01_087935 [Portunus trituberculatus]|uniref:Uncharacterized protein n=1 Tax=Portunus trituberculatus TaxID=210409 RepID=A0A5B7JE15_PORTR|nr:hypothetical protein [Portunus trituberculatus]
MTSLTASDITASKSRATQGRWPATPCCPTRRRIPTLTDSQASARVSRGSRRTASTALITKY